MSKTLQEIAALYVNGEMPGLKDVGPHDAVHQIATVYEYDKAEVRAAISDAEKEAQSIDRASEAVFVATDEEE